jgi:hypothetical protein
MNDLGMNLKSLVTFIFAKCETKILATLRSADQQGLDRAARRRLELRESNWRGYIWAATVAGRVNLKVAPRPELEVPHKRPP